MAPLISQAAKYIYKNSINIQMEIDKNRTQNNQATVYRVPSLRCEIYMKKLKCFPFELSVTEDILVNLLWLSVNIRHIHSNASFEPFRVVKQEEEAKEEFYWIKKKRDLEFPQFTHFTLDNMPDI